MGRGLKREISRGDYYRPSEGVRKAVNEALDPYRQPGKVRTMADMTPEELAALVPPRKGTK